MADKGKDDQVRPFRRSLVAVAAAAPPRGAHASGKDERPRASRSSHGPGQHGGPAFWASPGTHCGAARRRSGKWRSGPRAPAPY